MEDHAVSEIVGTLTLIGVVVLGIIIVNVVILSHPPPARIPSFEAMITNNSKLITITHQGGDTLIAGQYKILVDGVDQTGNFTNSGGAGPFSAGETLSWNALKMPQRAVVIYNGTGTGEVQILATRFPYGVFLPPNTNTSTPTPIVPPPLPVPPFVIIWTNLPAFGNATSSIQFTDSSTGYDINAYFWDFNDGNISTDKSPAHSFPCNTGDSCMYSINHSATNSSITSWLNRSSWVTIYKNLTPTVSFTQSPTSGQVPLAVSFDATWYGLIKVDSWVWNFGDSSSSTSEDPSHTYRSAGHYTVSLTATNYTLGQTTVTKASLIAAQPNPPWFNCNWLYRKNITLNGTAVSNSLGYFPVLINYIDTDLSGRARNDGYDILFTKEDGTTQIPHEIESFTKSSGSLTAWVNVPSLPSGTNTTIFMYYGNSGASSQQNPSGVWDTNFKGVWHLDEDPSIKAPQMNDSTLVYNGTSFGSMTTSDQVTGKINGALDFDGSNDYINTTYYQNSVSAYTIEAWAKTSATGAWNVIAQDRDGVPNDGRGHSLTLSIGYSYSGSYGIAGDVAFGDDTNSIYIGRWTSQTVNDNKWHHLVGTWSGGGSVSSSQFSIYIDGNPATLNNVGTGSDSAPLSGPPSGWWRGTLIAYHPAWGSYFPGQIDEVRISTTARSADWIKTEYRNQVNPALFDYPQPEEGWTC